MSTDRELVEAFRVSGGQAMRGPNWIEEKEFEAFGVTVRLFREDRDRFVLVSIDDGYPSDRITKISARGVYISVPLYCEHVKETLDKGVNEEEEKEFQKALEELKQKREAAEQREESEC
jgi:hypothetical protein